jgi:hypothetical protein
MVNSVTTAPLRVNSQNEMGVPAGMAMPITTMPDSRADTTRINITASSALPPVASVTWHARPPMTPVWTRAPTMMNKPTKVVPGLAARYQHQHSGAEERDHGRRDMQYRVGDERRNTTTTTTSTTPHLTSSAVSWMASLSLTPSPRPPAPGRGRRGRVPRTRSTLHAAFAHSELGMPTVIAFDVENAARHVRARRIIRET